MLDLLTGTAADCSGVSRRTFLRVGGLAALGLTLPTVPAGPGRRAGRPGEGQAVHPAVDAGRAEPHRHASTPSRTPRPRSAASSAPSRPRCPASASPSTCRCWRSRPTSSAVIRGHDPKNGSHGTADHLMMTGHKFNAVAAVPVLRLGRRQGARLQRRHARRSCSSAGTSTGASTAASPGFLGDEFNPFEVPDDPSRRRSRSATWPWPSDAERTRLDRRYAMLADLESVPEGGRGRRRR